MSRILIIEDEPKVASALQEGLAHEHHQAEIASTGEDGFFRAVSHSFDVILLDVMLPARSGLEILQSLRQRGCDTPVLMLTARYTTDDRVAGLDLGADDYLVKPFALPEVLARVRALLRRSRSAESLRLSLADLEMDLVTRRVVRSGQELDLTAREFELLEYLLRQQGHFASREMIARDVWREAARPPSLDNVIDVHIARLRKKVDVDGRQKLIHTIRGVGFVAREGEP